MPPARRSSTSAPAPTSSTDSGQAATIPADGIRFVDRVFVGGVAGSGKSGLINHLATGPRCQVLLYDTKDEFSIPGVEPVYRPEQIRWNERIIHVIDDRADIGDVEKLFSVCWDRKVGRSGKRYGLVVVAHELGDLCLDQPGKTPPAFSNYIRKGRAHGLGFIGGAQRPRNIPRISRTEVQHVFSFAEGFDSEDIPVMAGMHRMSVPEFEAALDAAAKLGEHSYVYGNRRARTNIIRPALPPHLYRRSIATGIDARDYRKDTAE